MDSMRHRLSLLRRCSWPAAIVVAVTGCDLGSLLDVTDPSRLLADAVETVEFAPALVDGAQSNFECAFGAHVAGMAMFTDEFQDHSFNGPYWSMDRREARGADEWSANDCPSASPSPYVGASRARWASDNVLKLLSKASEAEVPGKLRLEARAHLYSGFSLYILGADYCSTTIDVGPELSTTQAFGLAEGHFVKALTLAQGTGQSEIVNAARVGLARMALFLGKKTEALGYAKDVPVGFVYNANYSDAALGTRNPIYNINIFTTAHGPSEWMRELKTAGVPDPRTASRKSNQLGGDRGEFVWFQEKYVSFTAPIPVARWAEAQLIIAELEGGQVAVNIINTLRDRVKLPRFASTNEVEIKATVVDERMKELWLEGFRAYDIRRLNLPLVPASGTPYQVLLKGGAFGDARCLPLPHTETNNNPNFKKS